MGYGLDLLKRDEYKNWLQSMPEDSCTLCDWNKYQYVLHNGTYWLWIACRAPYWPYHTMLTPKRHFKEVNEMKVVEMGELIEMYSIAVRKFRSLNLTINEKPVDRYIVFWRLRENLNESESNTRRLEHFHIHLVPDRAGMFDPVLDENACDWDPKALVVEASDLAA